MSKIGFIGYGHMGSVLLNSLISSGAMPSGDVVISTRTKGKLAQLRSEYPDVEVVDSSDEVAMRCRRIFIMTGTLDVAGVIKEIHGHIDEKTHLIYISGGLEIKSVENVFGGKVTRLLPTLLSEVYEGYTLVCHNDRVDDNDMHFIDRLLEKIGQVKSIDERLFEVGGCLTSCAPAFIASILKHLSVCAVCSSSFSYEDAYELTLRTVLGTAELLVKTNEDFDQMVGRVATKGGATEQGVKVLEQRLPEIFRELLEKTLIPHRTRNETTRKQFIELKADMDDQA